MFWENRVSNLVLGDRGNWVVVEELMERSLTDS